MLHLLSQLAHAGHDHSDPATTIQVVDNTVQKTVETAPAATAEVVQHSAEAAGGLAALGLDWKAFLFQLITFIIVLLILRKFVFGKLVATLEGRREAVEKSIEHAAATEVKLKEAEGTIAKMLEQARTDADEVIKASQKEGSQIVEAAEGKAVKRAEHIVAEAKKQMDVEVGKVRAELKTETAKLVALATEKIIREKLDATKDASLIKASLADSEKKHG